MGNPMNGDIYEGQLRAGDVSLNKDEADRLKQMIPERRIEELMAKFERQGARAAPSSDDAPSRPMPRYKCHKEVWALKIKAIDKVTPTVEELQRILDSQQESPVFNAAVITPEDEGFAPFGVNQEYITKHAPRVGGYFVVYKDGYKSYSPAQAFEEGYTRM